MDLGLTEEQTMLQRFARDFLVNECPEDHVRAMEADSVGYSPELWRKIVQQGWTQLIIPERYGGLGLSFLDLSLLVEETGRAILPGPFLSNSLAAIALLECGGEDQKNHFLPLIGNGEMIWSVAPLEGPSSLEARQVSDGYILSGKQSGIVVGTAANAFLLRAALSSAPAEPEALFIIPAGTVGLEYGEDRSLAADHQGSLSLDGVGAGSSDLLGGQLPAPTGLSRLRAAAAILQSAYLLGLSQMASEITVHYIKERRQFGKPIAAFQALQHQTADNLTDLETSLLATRQAAALFATGDDYLEEAAHVAKAWVGEASRRILRRCMRMHGGMSFSLEYRLQFYFRRQLAFESSWGGTEVHRAALADVLLS